MNILKSAAFVALTASTLFATGPTIAQGAQVAFGGLSHDSSLPVEVTSDSLNVDQNSGQAVFSGNVLVGQGALRLSAGKVEVIYGQDGASIARLLASGGVLITNAGEAAEAQNAEYNLESSSVVLTGNVLLTQANSALSGERMVIDLNTGTGRMEGRVKTILQTGTPE